MADAAQRQRKLAAKAARRKAAVAEKKKKEGSSTTLAGRIRMAAMGPIVHCLMPTNLFEAGIGNVLVARRLPSGMLGCAWFLVDVFCLGVKDIFYREVSEAELRSRLEALSETQEFVEVEPTRARRLVRDAAAYAVGLGLPAAKDTPERTAAWRPPGRNHHIICVVMQIKVTPKHPLSTVALSCRSSK